MTTPPPIHLLPDESPPDHPGASTTLYQSDIALLNYLLQDLRALMRRAATGQVRLLPHQRVTWEVHGLQRRTVVCDPDQLLAFDDVHVVGFFGDRRPTADVPAVDEVEVALLEEFRSYPGILSYSSVELVDDQWANLVVHQSPTDREAWRESAVHVDAVDRIAAPTYRSVRIHNGCIKGGVIGPETVVIQNTKYWDYDATPTWHAMRVLPGGATETLESPGADLNRPIPPRGAP